jgi:hypothetical protein
MKKLLISLVVCLTILSASSVAIQASAQAMTMAQLIDLFIGLGIIPADKAAAARAVVGNTVPPVATSTPSITVLSPNGGENLKVGETYNITWKSQGANATNYNVQLELFDTRFSNEDTPRSSNVIAHSIPNIGSYSWTIPASLGGFVDFGNINQPIYKIVVHSWSDSITGTALGGGSVAPFTITSKTLPTASITAEGSDASTTIAFGNTANISWSSTNAKTCKVSGGTINITNLLSGTKNTGNLSVPTTYTISCTNIAGQTVTDSVIVNVIAKELPTVKFYSGSINAPGDIEVVKGSSATLKWEASGTTKSCTLNAAAVALTGSREIKNITTNSTQTLKCKNDANGEVIKVLNIKIIINPATAFVAWEDVLNLINLLRK